MQCKELCLYWRASRVPAAAVIPAPGVSMVDAAVKRSVVLYVVGREVAARKGCTQAQRGRDIG